MENKQVRIRRNILKNNRNNVWLESCPDMPKLWV